MSSFPLTNSYFSRWAQTLHHQLDTSRYTISPGYAGWPNDRWRHGKGNQPDFFSIYWVFIGYTGLPHLRYSMLIGGDWNHGIWLDFPETVGNGIMIPTDDSSIIFQRGRSTTNQIYTYIYTIKLTQIFHKVTQLVRQDKKTQRDRMSSWSSWPLKAQPLPSRWFAPDETKEVPEGSVAVTVTGRKRWFLPWKAMEKIWVKLWDFTKEKTLGFERFKMKELGFHQHTWGFEQIGDFMCTIGDVSWWNRQQK